MEFKQQLVRPDQINYLFHGSGGSVFIALGKIELIDGCGLACMARQELLGIVTIVPCKHGIGVALMS